MFLTFMVYIQHDIIRDILTDIQSHDEDDASAVIKSAMSCEFGIMVEMRGYSSWSVKRLSHICKLTRDEVISAWNEPNEAVIVLWTRSKRWNGSSEPSVM
jgi:hypothetical protein